MFLADSFAAKVPVLDGLEDNPNPKFLSKKHSERYGYLFSREKGLGALYAV